MGDLVIINNESNHQRWEAPDTVSRIHHIDIPTNLGVAGSWNLGIKSMPYHPHWVIANFDVVLNRFLLEDFESMATETNLVLSSDSSAWCVFSIGAQVIDKVGLFDESLYPAYFEDNDMERRIRAHGFAVETSQRSVYHDNSSTLLAGYAERNATTYQNNNQYYQDKTNRGDLSSGVWSLTRRVQNRWD